MAIRKGKPSAKSDKVSRSQRRAHTKSNKKK